MKTVKVSIQDEDTLVLQEDAQKGDTIDLKSIHETDIDKTTITSVVHSIKRDAFNAELKKATETIEREAELKLQIKEKEYADIAKDELSKKDQEIAALNSQLDSVAEKTESKIKLQALEERQELEKDYQQRLVDKDIAIGKIRHEKELNEEKLKEQIRSGESALVSLKEMRSKMSTKMLGESLEIYCQNEFNRIRSFAFPYAEFGKDNEVSDTGS